MTFCFYDNWIHTPEEETHERRNKNNMKPSDDPTESEAAHFSEPFQFRPCASYEI